MRSTPMPMKLASIPRFFKSSVRRTYGESERTNQRRLAVALHGEPLPLDPRFQRAIHGLEEIVAVGLDVKTNQVRAKQAVEDFTLPRADSECFWIRPRNVPENRHSRVGTRFFNHAWQQSKVIVLHKDQRMLRGLNFLQHRISKLPICVLIAFPIG